MGDFYECPKCGFINKESSLKRINGNLIVCKKECQFDVAEILLINPLFNIMNLEVL